MNSLGKKVKALRVNKGWNQEAVAKQLDISIPAYSKIESGVTDINLSRLQQLARLYDLSVVQLLTEVQQTDDRLNSNNKRLLEREAEVIALQQQIIRLFEELREQKRA